MKNQLDCVTRPQENMIDPDTLTTRYNEKGVIDKKINEDLTAAIVYGAGLVGKNRDLVYKVKIDRFEKLYDPNKKDRFYGLAKRDSLTNEALFKFKVVNKSCFEQYIKYLVKRDNSILLMAERELKCRV